MPCTTAVTTQIFHYYKIINLYLCWIYKLNFEENYYKHTFSILYLAGCFAPYLRLKGDEMLLIFIIYFSIYYICYIHHWGQEKNRDCFKCYNQRKQTNKATSDCLPTNSGIKHTVAFFFFFNIQVQSIFMFQRQMKLSENIDPNGVGAQMAEFCSINSFA